MKVIFTREQLVARLNEIRELVDLLDKLDRYLRATSYDPGRGWPNSSGPGGGSGGGPTIVVKLEPGDDGYDLDGPDIQYDRIRSTSVEATALSPDTLNDAKHFIWMKVQHAHGAITDAWNAGEKATRPLRAAKPPTPVDPDQIWCTSCARAGIHQPRGNPKEIGKDSTLCSFCFRYTKAHDGTLPPERLCELKSEGVTLTDRIVAEVETAERRERASKKRSKRKARR